MPRTNHQQTKLEIACEIEAVAGEFGAGGTDIQGAISRAFESLAFKIRESVRREQEKPDAS